MGVADLQGSGLLQRGAVVVRGGKWKIFIIFIFDFFWSHKIGLAEICRLRLLDSSLNNHCAPWIQVLVPPTERRAHEARDGTRSVRVRGPPRATAYSFFEWLTFSNRVKAQRPKPQTRPAHDTAAGAACVRRRHPRRRSAAQTPRERSALAPHRWRLTAEPMRRR